MTFWRTGIALIFKIFDKVDIPQIRTSGSNFIHSNGWVNLITLTAMIPISRHDNAAPVQKWFGQAQEPRWWKIWLSCLPVSPWCFKASLSCKNIITMNSILFIEYPSKWDACRSDDCRFLCKGCHLIQHIVAPKSDAINAMVHSINALKEEENFSGHGPEKLCIHQRWWNNS